MKIMMEETKTRQISNAIKKDIQTGKYKPGDRLSNVRDLAAVHGVSVRIIHLVLRELQAKHMVYVEQGRGAFVTDMSNADALEVYFLLYGKPELYNKYFNEMLKISSPPYLESGFNFTVRTAFNEKPGMETLKKELSFINSLSELNCVLTGTMHVRKEELTAYRKLRCPVIFLGDSYHEETESLLECQLTGDNGFTGYKALDFICRSCPGVKKVGLVTFSLYYFHRLFIEGVAKAAKDRGISLDIHEVPPDLLREFKTEKYVRYMNELKASRGCDKPLIIYDFNDVVKADVLPHYFNASSPYPCIMTEFTPTQLLPFYKRIFQRVRDISANPDLKFKDRFPVPFAINNIAAGRRHICDAEGNFTDI